ncbi:TadE/TadG family type IV pilus assembly protein [Cryobacterium psychrophilum]|uniref:Pilus assembly protein n=1 Tax=Cryobacterium psychrophilum TaxID=41988 RepID=A0A4Y8KQ67_9MICO|nr:TadE/TadG family type IV pilus assembly protein [Cryobacterium psychrophilum]TDW30408.1 TadE-like protein [Cryobacterium psychrophilum]TFD79092.1 pilus assembly protein [Cryobacterium psychrophilum]
MMRLRNQRGERGAAAVEFALILPVLLLLVLGVIEFSRVYNVQISLSNAAREGARTMAIHNNPVQARSAASLAAPSVTSPALTAGNVTVSPTDCAAGSTVTVTIHYDVHLMTGYFGPTLPLTGKGVMLCGG